MPGHRKLIEVCRDIKMKEWNVGIMEYCFEDEIPGK